MTSEEILFDCEERMEKAVNVFREELRGLRTAACWTRTVSIGALAGMLLGLNGVMESMLPLFLVWQPAVAASIGHGLGRPGSPPLDAAAAASAPADPTRR